MTPLSVFHLFQCLANYTTGLSGEIGSSGACSCPTSLDVCTTPACVEAASIYVKSIDYSVEPCDDFYQFVCGKWLDTTDIPDDRAYFDTLNQVEEKVQQQVRHVLGSEPNKNNSNAENIAIQVYNKCMDKESYEEVKSTPLWNFIKDLGGYPLFDPKWDQKKAPKIEELLGKIAKESGQDIFFSSLAYNDQGNASRRILQIISPSLGLGPREYYLNATEYKDYRNAYAVFRKSLHLFLASDSNLTVPENLDTQLDEIFTFEIKIAELTSPPEEARDATATYNPTTLEEFKKENSWFDWDLYFEQFIPKEVLKTFNGKTPVNVFFPKYMAGLAKLIPGTEPKIVYNFVFAELIREFTDILDKRFQDAADIFDNALTGRESPEPRWKKCITHTDPIDRAVGSLYVKKYVPPGDRDVAITMVEELVQAFKQMLDALKWMDKETVGKAKIKADTIVKHIGYADYVYNKTELDDYYGQIQFDSNKTSFEAFIGFWAWEKAFNLKKILQPVNKTEFDGSAAVVNAFYDPAYNSITFPSGILQPPAFSGTFPKAVNFGAMGAVIGHEITHGFDDQGSKYDGAGNLANWWSLESQKGFTQRTQCIVNQYSNYHVPQIGLNLKGDLTQGENIADNGGLKMAHKAYQAYKKRTGKPEMRLPGLQNFTDDQIFFISFAYTWCSKEKNDILTQLVLSNEHSPPKYRVLGTLSNSDDFSKAFNCKAGTTYNPLPSSSTKCEIW